MSNPKDDKVLILRAKPSPDDQAAIAYEVLETVLFRPMLQQGCAAFAQMIGLPVSTPLIQVFNMQYPRTQWSDAQRKVLHHIIFGFDEDTNVEKK